MITLTCIEKIRNKSKHIVNYCLVDTLGNTVYFKPEELKAAIDQQRVIVTNLVISKKGKLIDKKIKGYAYFTPSFLSHFISAKALSFYSNEDLEAIQRLCAKYSLLKNAKVHADIAKHLYGIETVTNIKIFSDYQICLTRDKGVCLPSELFKNKPYTSIDLTNVWLEESNLSYYFYGCKAKSIKFGDMDTSYVHNMYRTFSKLEMDTLDLSGFNTSNVKSMASMFKSSRIKHLIIPFNTENVEHMLEMFTYFRTEILDVSTFETTSNLDGLTTMFDGCNASRLLTKNDYLRRVFMNRDLDSLPFD